MLQHVEGLRTGSEHPLEDVLGAGDRGQVLAAWRAVEQLALAEHVLEEDENPRVEAAGGVHRGPVCAVAVGALHGGDPVRLRQVELLEVVDEDVERVRPVGGVTHPGGVTEHHDLGTDRTPHVEELGTERAATDHLGGFELEVALGAVAVRRLLHRRAVDHLRRLDVVVRRRLDGHARGVARLGGVEAGEAVQGEVEAIAPVSRTVGENREVVAHRRLDGQLEQEGEGPSVGDHPGRDRVLRVRARVGEWRVVEDPVLDPQIEVVTADRVHDRVAGGVEHRDRLDDVERSIGIEGHRSGVARRGSLDEDLHRTQPAVGLQVDRADVLVVGGQSEGTDREVLLGRGARGTHEGDERACLGSRRTGAALGSGRRSGALRRAHCGPPCQAGRVAAPGTVRRGELRVEKRQHTAPIQIGGSPGRAGSGGTGARSEERGHGSAATRDRCRSRRGSRRGRGASQTVRAGVMDP